jgi:hypothetical protein
MVTRAFAVEDGNLQTRSLVTSRNKLFSDIDLRLLISHQVIFIKKQMLQQLNKLLKIFY